MKPFLLKPACKDSIWGGTKLKSLFRKEHAAPVISEAWELSVHPDGLSLADSGPHKGRPLAELVKDPAVLGRHAARYPTFPLMIKWIDSQRPLSIQVHPDNNFAMEQENDMGKTEMWYILQCEPGAYLYYGFQHEISREEFVRLIREDSLLDVVKKVPVKPGDVFFIPAGTLHAIGPGILLAEVQQSSNVTYRIYDYGRLDADGKPRQLHVEKAVQVTDLVPARQEDPVPVSLGDPSDRLLASCPYFAVARQQIQSVRSYNGDDGSFHAFICCEGTGVLKADGESFPVSAGATVFIPANSGPFSLSGTLSLLDVFVPDPSLF